MQEFVKRHRASSALILFAIPAGLLGLSLLVADEFAQGRQLRETVDGSISTRAALAELLSENQDIETGARGFVITGDQRFLEPFASGSSGLGRTLAMLDQRARAEPELAPTVQRLRALSHQRHENARTIVELVQQGNGKAARDLVASGQGRALMDRLRIQVHRADRAEVAKLASVTDLTRGTRFNVERSVYLMLSTIALLLALVTAFVRRMNRLRLAALDRLEALTERQKAMFDGAVDAMLLLDEHGDILELNPSVTRLFGYGEEELMGMHNTILLGEPTNLKLSMAWLRSIGPADAGRAGQQREFLGRRKDGTLFPTDVAISRMNAQGRTLYFAIIRDITERKRIETIKSEFVSTVSHELRTPLTSIGGSLGLLAGGAVGQLDEKAARLVTIARSNCERLVRLINDMLDIEKIESGNMAFDMRRLQVGPLVRRTVEANEGFATAHGVRLTAHLPPWPQCISGDPDRLEQLVTNLVSNAIKHSPPGGEVEIWGEQRGDDVRIEVRDRGAGIPADFRERIFGKFAMADGSDSRAKGGTGLGLAIAREIAQRHGGTVDFADRPGGGTIFYAELPMLEPSPMALDLPEHLPLVLHLDDDQDCLSVVRSAFEGRAAVLPVASLVDARAIIGQRRFAAAILDVGMGVDDGLALVPELRAVDPTLPIVLFTAIEANYSGHAVDSVLVKSRGSLDRLVEKVMDRIAARERVSA